jgi:hypothetical protein
MDKTTLVKRDVEVEGLVMTALSRQGVPVTLVDWQYMPQLDEWQLVIPTPLYDKYGPRNANATVVTALQRGGVYSDVPMRRIFVKSPLDPSVRELEREVKMLTEGTLHVVNFGPVTSDDYSATYTPYTGRGGAIPARRFKSILALRSFLEDELRIRRSSVEEALSELERTRSTSIPNVRLTLRQAKKLGLA